MALDDGRVEPPSQVCLCTLVDTESVNVRELRAALATLLRRAESGARTVITSGGRPVAQVAPLDADAPDLDRLIAAAAVIPPRRTGRWRPPEAVSVWAGVRVDQALRELRG